MRNNKFAILVYLMIAGFIPAIAGALPYQPEEPVDIITQPADTMHGPAFIQWRVAPEAQQKGASGIAFFREGAGQAICRLVFSGPTTDISWEGMEIPPKTIQTGDLLIVSGVPVPCDVMPVVELFSADEPKEYEARTSAGGRTFVERIQVSSAPVGVEEARNNGWIKFNVGKKDTLRLIKAVDLITDELMVQQLWSDDGSWWIYEETPFRRSWRVR
jgi:hypothetical protein